MRMLKTSKMLLVSLMSLLLIGFVGSAGAATNLTVTSNIDVTRGDGTTYNDFMPLSTDGTVEATITIDAKGKDTDTSPFVEGSYITINAPSGMMFVNGSCAVAQNADQADALERSSASGNWKFLWNEAGSGGQTGVTLDTDVGDIKLVEETYTDNSGRLIKAVTGVKYPITGTTSGTDKVVIAFQKLLAINTSLSSAITVVPIPEKDATAMNEVGKTFEVIVNDGSGSAETFNVGSVDVLKAPKLAKAELVGTTGVDLYFNTEIDLADITQGNGIRIDGVLNGNDEGGFDSSLGEGTTAKITVSTSDYTKVELRNINNPPDTNGTDWIDVDTSTLIQNKLGAWPGDVGQGRGLSSLQAQRVYIVLSGAEVTSVTTDKTIVGCNDDNNATTYSNALRDDNTNKLSINFNVTAGVPFEWRIVNKDTGEKLSVDIAAGEANYKLQTTTNLTESSDVISVPSSENSTGTYSCTVAFNSDDDAGDAPMPLGLRGGEEGTLEIQASIDKFKTKTTCDVTMDRKRPSIVTSGDNKAASLSRTQVQFQFDEEMDRTSVERKYVDESGNGSQSTSSEPYIYKVINTNNTAATGDDEFVAVSSVTLASDNKTVTLTTSLMDVNKPHKIYVLGSNAAEHNSGYASDSTKRAGAMDKAGNYGTTTAVLNADISSPENLNGYIASNAFTVAGGALTSITSTSTDLYTVVKDGARIKTAVNGDVNLGTIYVRAVDAADKTTVVSTVTAEGATETASGVYTDTDLTLTTGLTAASIVIQASTTTTFSTYIESDPLSVDNVKPKVVSASWLAANTVKVVFDEKIQVAAAQLTTSYSISGLQISKAELSLADEKTVTLTTTNMTSGKTYTIDVNSVEDLAGNEINTSADSVGTDQAIFTEGTTGIATSVESLTVTVGQTATFTISGGTTPYTATPTDSTAATAEVDESTVTITGVREGSTNITVKDANGNTTTVLVTVSPATTELSIVSDVSTIGKDDTATLTILNGTPSFTLDASPADAVTGLPSDSTSDTSITITGAEVATDTTVTITVTDADNNTDTVDITVTAPGVTDTPQPIPTEPTPPEDMPLETDEEIAAAPVSVGTVTDGKIEEIQLAFSFPPYEEAVDIYVAIAIPRSTGELDFFFVNSNGDLVAAIGEFPAYATDTTEAISTTIFDSFAVCTPFGPSVPQGQWYAFYLIAPTTDPAGDITAAMNGGAYILKLFGFTVSCE